MAVSKVRSLSVFASPRRLSVMRLTLFLVQCLFSNRTVFFLFQLCGGVFWVEKSFALNDIFLTLSTYVTESISNIIAAMCLNT